MFRRALIASMLASGAAVSLASARALSAGADGAAVVEWAKTRARSSDVAAAAAIGAERAQVIAIGEPAHGAAEPLALRNAIIELLVTKRGVTSVALETGSTGARVIDAFVGGASGDAHRLAWDNLSWGFGAFQANAALIGWLRDHNSAGGNVRFFGIDVPGGDEKGGMSAAPRVLDAPLALLRHGNPQMRALGERLRTLARGLDHAEYARMTLDERTALTTAVMGMGRTLAAMTGEASALEDARHDAEAASTLLRMSEVWPDMASPGSVPPGFFRVTNLREKAMADNVIRILKHRGGRVAVFAHDGHVMNASLSGGAWDSLAEAPLPMGARLRRALGRGYHITGMTAAENASTLPAGGRPGSLDLALSAVGRAPILIDLAGAPPGWVDSQQTMRTNFLTESRLEPRPAFDTVIALPKLTPAAKIRT